LTNSSSLKNLDAKIAPLTDNGGPNLTMALLPGSPAIDAADSVFAPVVDQRGFTRPLGSASDIGAYEYGYPALLTVSAFSDGVNVLIYGTCGRTCQLYASSDLTNWFGLVTNTIGSDGTMLHQDKFPVGVSCRFYRLILP
jgi:hypothetical protein